MEEELIRKLLKKTPITAPYFCGVFAIDEIPWEKQKDQHEKTCFFIFNLDPSYEEGSHWVCIMLDPTERSFYFDSFGFPPLDPLLEKFMGNIYQYNDEMLQNPTSTNCGQWCLYFIYHMITNGNFNDFLKKFPHPATDLYNDYLLSSKVRKIFKIDVWPLDQSYFLKQLLTKA